MERSTQVNGGFGLVDNLTMTYDGNQLTEVAETATDYNATGGKIGTVPVSTFTNKYFEI